jgi:hypothetical protein
MIKIPAAVKTEPRVTRVISDRSIYFTLDNYSETYGVV